MLYRLLKLWATAPTAGVLNAFKNELSRTLTGEKSKLRKYKLKFEELSIANSQQGEILFSTNQHLCLSFGC